MKGLSRDGRILGVVYLTIALDAAGIGLVWPVLPSLLKSLGGDAATGWPYGVFLALYALMQFLFSPVLGQMSDRWGRRPVLIMSLAGGVLNYAVMAMSPPLWILYVARAIGGMTGANAAVASAYLADVTAPDQRAHRFGRLSACFGVGFMFGPAVGGFVAHWGSQYPFIVAAIFTAITLLLAVFALPRTPPAETLSHTPSLNPLSVFASLRSFKSLTAIVGVSFVFAMVAEVGGTIWVLYSQTKFHWDSLTVGLSLTLFGLCHAVVQAGLTGPLTRRFGDRIVLTGAIALDIASYVMVAFATQGWQALALIPVFCLGGLAQPVLAALLANKVNADDQGKIQGLLASFNSLASIIAPVVITTVFFATRYAFPGLVWVGGAVLYLTCLPVILGRKLYRRVTTS